jgi:DNA uptake protein ComE-like DNA-binding protein
MTEERRENDKIILDRLEKIGSDVTNIKIDLALNTKDTSRLSEYQKTANGKLAAQQASIQALQASQLLTAAFIKKEQDEKEKKEGNKSSTINRVYWLLAGIGLTLLGRIITYLEQIGFFKHIIK